MKFRYDGPLENVLASLVPVIDSSEKPINMEIWSREMKSSYDIGLSYPQLLARDDDDSVDDSDYDDDHSHCNQNDCLLLAPPLVRPRDSISSMVDSL